MNTFFVGAEVDALASAHFRYRVKIRGTDLWEGAFCDARDADRHAESCATKQPTFVRHGVSASSTRTPNSETLNDALHDVGCLREIASQKQALSHPSAKPLTCKDTGSDSFVS